MHISRLLGFFLDLHRALSIGFLPTLKEVMARPSLLLKPREVSRIYMSFVWEEYGPGLDMNSKAIKETLITTHANGVVLDIGAGERLSFSMKSISADKGFFPLTIKHYAHIVCASTLVM